MSESAGNGFAIQSHLPERFDTLVNRSLKDRILKLHTRHISITHIPGDDEQANSDANQDANGQQKKINVFLVTVTQGSGSSVLMPSPNCRGRKYTPKSPLKCRAERPKAGTFFVVSGPP